jgi:hypothetical protein
VRGYGSEQNLDFSSKSGAWRITLTVILSTACPKKGSFRWLH